MAEKVSRPKPEWFDYIPVIGPIIRGTAEKLEETRKRIEGDAQTDGDAHNPTPEPAKRTGK